MTPKRIDAVLITTAEPEAMARFYRDQLGVPLVVEHHGPEAHYGCDIDGVHFAIHTAAAGGAGASSIAISFEVADVDATVASLAKLGVVIDMQPRDLPFGRLASVRDPGGNLVYLHA